MNLGLMMRHDPARMRFARSLGAETAALVLQAGEPWLPGGKRVDVDWRPKGAALIGEFQEAGLRVSCLSLYPNVLDADERRAAEAEAFLRGAIHLASETGVGLVGTFAGRVLDRPLEESLPAFERKWGELGRFAEGLGVRVAFENCPKGPHHFPPGGNNFLCTPAMWERAFDALPLSNLGLEWDPSHFVALGIEPIENLRRFGAKIFHVHAKDARREMEVVSRYGLYHPGAVVHCFPGLGDLAWREIVRELRAQGYNGPLDVEGHHDPIYRGEREDEGVRIAFEHLAPLIADE